MSAPTAGRVAGLLGLVVLGLGVLTCGGDGNGPTLAINISTSAVAFSAVPGGSADPKTVSITPSTGELTGLEQSISYSGSPPSPWLSATLDDPSATLENPAILTIQVTSTDLPAGTYTAAVTIQSGSAGNSPKVNVSFTVQAATTLALTTQPSATVASGAPLPQAPVVQLWTAEGTPVAQTGVEISVALEGGGTLAGTTTVTTDDEGAATFDGLSVAALAGEQLLLFTAPGLAEVRSNPITITVGGATQIFASSVTPQMAESGTQVNDPPAAIVTDAAGNPVAGIAVTFAVTQGGGIIDPTASVATSSEGIASLTSWQLGGTPGTNTVTATAAGLAGSPVEFSATGTSGGVVPGPVSAANSSVSASPASLTAGSSGTTITVAARDADNNLIGGADVTLSSTGSNDTFGSTSLTTGTSGGTLGKASTTYTSTKAEPKSISAQITAGSLTVTPSPATVTVTPGPASASSSTVTPSPATIVGLTNTSTLSVTVKDAYLNPISGRMVTLAFVGGSPGGVIIPPASTTSPAGLTTGLVGSDAGGSYEVQATVSAGTPVVITQTASVTFLLTFTGDIEPLFQQSFDNADPSGGSTTPCSNCHSPNVIGGALPDLGFGHLTDLQDGIPVVDPGNSDGSLLIHSLEHDPGLSPSKMMPDASQRLPQAVIDKIRRWINQEDVLRE
jgi:Big-like domain-containing protein